MEVLIKLCASGGRVAHAPVALVTMVAAPGPRCIRFAIQSAYVCGRWHTVSRGLGWFARWRFGRRGRGARRHRFRVASPGQQPGAAPASRALFSQVWEGAAEAQVAPRDGLRHVDRDASLAAAGPAARLPGDVLRGRPDKFPARDTAEPNPFLVIYNDGAINVSRMAESRRKPSTSGTR